jgi:hypothetical protein
MSITPPVHAPSYPAGTLLVSDKRTNLCDHSIPKGTILISLGKFSGEGSRTRIKVAAGAGGIGWVKLKDITFANNGVVSPQVTVSLSLPEARALSACALGNSPNAEDLNAALRKISELDDLV